MIWKVLTLRCPHCGKASVADGFFKTSRNCRACGVLLENEAGFFAGAIYPLYGMAGALGGMVALVALLALNWSPFKSVAAGCGVVLLASPYLFWLSRAVFLHAEKKFFKRLGN